MPIAFVVMPYRPAYEKIFTSVLRPVLEESGFKVMRADIIPSSSAFIEDIHSHIKSADLIVVEATEPNLNVYYELGAAFAHQSADIILLTQRPDQLPSDTRGYRHLVYHGSKLKDLRMSFIRWVENTASYRRFKQRVHGQVMVRGEYFPDIFDSVSYARRQEGTTEEQLLAKIRAGSFISCKFAYGNEYGARHWLRLCQHPLYSVYHESIAFFSKNTAKILQLCGDNFVLTSPDVISLGPGDGEKDKIILHCLGAALDERERTDELFYYPMDISDALLSAAIQTIFGDQLLRRRVKVKAIFSDFNNLNEFRPVFNYRKEPNLFLLLGNTLGNMLDEMEFLQRLYRAMYPGDILVLEVRLHADELIPGGPEEERIGLYFSPLKLLGVPFDRKSITHEPSPKPFSQITGTESYVTRAHDVQIGDILFEDVWLNCINFYDSSSLLQSLEAIDGFEVIGNFNTAQLGIFVLRKDR